MSRRSALSIPFLLVTITLAGCAGTGANGNANSPSSSNRSEGGTAQPSPSPSPSTPPLNYAEGWDEIQIEEPGYAKTALDRAGHYGTDRNACGKPAAGVMDADTFRKFVATVNAALTPPPANEDFCIDTPPDYRLKGAQDKVEISTPEGKRTLFEAKASFLMCTRIGDKEAAKALFDTINQMILVAFEEEHQLCQ